MATRDISLNGFALDKRQGRTPEPLNILSAETLVKLANTDTYGAVAIFQQTMQLLAGPPLHRHGNEDEWFYVLEGQVTVEIDGRRIVLPAGHSAFAPRGTVHAIQNFGRVQAQLLILVSPGHFQRWFEDLSELSKEQAAPDSARIAQLAGQYGIEVLGPPLS